MGESIRASEPRRRRIVGEGLRKLQGGAWTTKVSCGETTTIYKRGSYSRLLGPGIAINNGGGGHPFQPSLTEALLVDIQGVTYRFPDQVFTTSLRRRS